MGDPGKDTEAELPVHDCGVKRTVDKGVWAEELEQNRWNKTAGTGQLGQHSRDNQCFLDLDPLGSVTFGLYSGIRIRYNFLWIRILPILQNLMLKMYNTNYCILYSIFWSSVVFICLYDNLLALM
jgi:hypothetical protein